MVDYNCVHITHASLRAEINFWIWETLKYVNLFKNQDSNLISIAILSLTLYKEMK